MYSLPVYRCAFRFFFLFHVSPLSFSACIVAEISLHLHRYWPSVLSCIWPADALMEMVSWFCKWTEYPRNPSLKMRGRKGFKWWRGQNTSFQDASFIKCTATWKLLCLIIEISVWVVKGTILRLPTLHTIFVRQVYIAVSLTATKIGHWIKQYSTCSCIFDRCQELHYS